MKSKVLFLVLFTLLLCAPAWAQKSYNAVNSQVLHKSATLTVITPGKTTWVVAIPDATANAMSNGWWDAWHQMKMAGQYEEAPITFTNLAPGGYTLVVYDPAADPNEGGGDSIVIENLHIEGGHQHFHIFSNKDFKEWNCLSCPWLYVYNGTGYDRVAEILKDVVGRANKTTTVTPLELTSVLDKTVRVRILEEKDEVTYIDRLLLRVDGEEIPAVSVEGIHETLVANDDEYHIMRKGDTIELEFVLPEGLHATESIEIIATGYYDPDKSMLDAAVGQRFVSELVGR